MKIGNAGPATHPTGLDFGQSMHVEMAGSFADLVLRERVGWVARYGPRGKTFYKYTPPKGYRFVTLLSLEESELLREGFGLGIIPVQRAPRSSERLDNSSGKILGNNMAAWARLMGIPPRVHLWCDLEGKATSIGTKSCMDYVNAWADVVVANGYQAGLYLAHSLPSGLGSRDLDRLTNITCFWRSANKACIPTPKVTFVIRQHPTKITWLYHKGLKSKPFPVMFKYDMDTLHTGWTKPPLLWYGSVKNPLQAPCVKNHMIQFP